MKIFNVLIAGAVALSGGVATAEIAAAKSRLLQEMAIRKVDVAGRQRMLSQRIAKAACLKSGGINAGANNSEMLEATDQFEKALSGLHHGDEELKLTPEKFSKVLAALEIVENHWAEYEPHVDQATGPRALDHAELAETITYSTVVLKSMNEAVGIIARAYANNVPDISLGMTMTVDVAGRQRMLTQKMTKEMCAAVVTGNADYLKSFATSFELFDKSLGALQTGFEPVAIIAPPSPEIAEKLAKVEELWAELRPTAAAVASGEMPSRETLEEFSVAIEPVLVTMHQAVGLYGTVVAD